MVRAILLGLLASGAALAQEYVVQPGDTCAGISRKLWPDDPARLDLLHSMNPALGPPPHHLKPGTHLKTVANPDATITFFKPMVQRKPRAQPTWQEVSQGQDLFRLDSVTTLAGAGAEVTFREQNKLRMDENALIVIYGGTPALDPVANRSGAIELLQGDLALKLSQMRGESLQVRTPGALVAGGMKSGRVGVDADKMSRVSVFEGDAKVSASGKSVAVREGFGTRVARGKPPEPPEPLPAAPSWAGTAPPVRVLMGAATAEETLAWASSGASRFQVSRDPAFNDLLVDEKAAVAPLSFHLAPGRYFTRVWAVNGKGMAGPPGPVWTLDVLAVKAEGAAPAGSGFRGGPGPVQLQIDAPAAVPLFLDGKAISSRVVSISEPGKHELIAGEGAQASRTFVEIVSPPPPPPVVVVAPPPPVVVVPPPRPPPSLPSYFQSRAAAGTLPDPWRDDRPELELDLQSIGRLGAVGAVRAGAGFEAARVFAAAGTVSGDRSGRFGGFGAMAYPLQGRVFSLGLGAEFNGPLAGGDDPLLHSNVRVSGTFGARLDRFAISTTQSAFAAGVTGWNGNLAASYRLADDFFVQASIEGASVSVAAVDDKGLAALAGLRYGDGTFDVTLAGRAGMYTGGRDLWNAGSLMLSVRWSGLGLPETPPRKHKWVPPY